MKIIAIIGPRGAGKSVIGKDLAKKLNYEFIELDENMMDYLKDYGGIMGFAKKKGEELNDVSEGWREYYKKLKEYISKYLIPKIEKNNENVVLDCGGGTTYSKFKESVEIYNMLKPNATFVLIKGGKTDKEAINKIFSIEIERRESAKNEEREYAMKDFSDSELYQKVKDDYRNRIEGFREQADIIIYNEGLVEDASSKIISELGQKEII